MKKKHHIIPKCYLENFVDEEDYIWILDIKDNIFQTKPKNILSEHYFYTITLKNGEKSFIIEDTLANIEGAYISIFREKIEKNISLTDEERARVAIFVAALFLRTKPKRESIRKMFKQLNGFISDWRKRFKSMSDEQKSFFTATPSSNKREFINTEDVDEYLENLNEHHSVSIIEQLPEIAQIIFDMKWSVWIDKNKNFITSDNPVVLLRPTSIKKYGPNAIGSRPGLLYEDVELTLPLSKDRLLLAGWILKKDSYIEVTDNLVETINHRTITGSSERVVTKSRKQAETIKNKYTETVYKNNAQV